MARLPHRAHVMNVTATVEVRAMNAMSPYRQRSIDVGTREPCLATTNTPAIHAIHAMVVYNSVAVGDPASP